MTPLTHKREAALRWALACCEAHRANPAQTRAAILGDGAPGYFATLAPKRKAAWGDMVGRALQSLAAWEAGPFPAPMFATMREIAAALGEPPPVWADRPDILVVNP
jgi:hypothetical protein